MDTIVAEGVWCAECEYFEVEDFDGDNCSRAPGAASNAPTTPAAATCAATAKTSSR